ncbi:MULTISPECIES: molybdopterin-guanine dinucleotide biosynthesis protein B [Hyphomicrobiales]|uniref:molybdopterin-guanine dinucleotide biosynthesis protein B n=1 Tax=Hyphomicrobiales TaxID=356 RepID=UPI003266140F
MTANVVGVTGWQNSGKTTLVTKLIGELRRRGYRVASVKHAHHDFDIDHEGTDSYRHRAAGASEVLLVSARRWALIHELGKEREPSLDEILRKLAPSDFVVVEGYKREPIPKIEVRRRNAAQRVPLAPEDPYVIGIVTDYPCEAAIRPVFDIIDITGITELVLSHFHLDAIQGDTN